MAVSDPIAAGCGGQVLVSRDGGGDPRRLLVPVSELRRPVLDSVTGGRGVRLAEPELMAYMFCSLIPAGVEFGHGHVHCRRRGRPASIRVVVDREGTDRAVYARLLAMAEGVA